MNTKIQEIRNLVSLNKISEAIKALRTLGVQDRTLKDEILSISAKENHLNTLRRNNLLDANDISQQQNQLNYQILQLLNVIESNTTSGAMPTPQPTPPVQPIQKRRSPWTRGLFILCLILAIVALAKYYLGTKATNTPKNPTEIVDSRDNNKYRVKKIGNTYWTLDNMRFNIQGSKCRDCATKGRHYNFEMAKKVCPDGWKLPLIRDFNNLKKEGGNFQNTIELADIQFNGMYGRSTGGFGTFAAFWTGFSGNDGNGRHFFFNKKNDVNIAKHDVQGNDQMYSCRCIKK